MFTATNPPELTLYKLAQRARRGQSPKMLGTTLAWLAQRARRGQWLESIEQIELEASWISDEGKQHPEFGDLQAEIARAKARVLDLSSKKGVQS